MTGFEALFPQNLLWCIGAAHCRQHSGHNSLGCVHVHNGWHADARRLDNVNDVDALAGLVWLGVVVSRDVGRDDDGDDDAIPGANAVTVPPGHRNEMAWTHGLAHRTGGGGVLLCVDSFRNSRLSPWCRIGDSGDATTGVV